MRVHAADGQLQRELALPGVGTAAGFGGRWGDEETFYSYTSLVTPADILRLDLKSGDKHGLQAPQDQLRPQSVRNTARLRHQQGRRHVPR